MGKLTEAEMRERLGEIFGLNPTQVREFMDDVWDQFELNSELAAYFRSLRPRYKTAILSNAWPDARREEHALFNFEAMTDLIIYSYEEKTAKPERRIFEITCERLGVHPAEIVFLDDSERIVEAATAFGIHAFLFLNTAQAIADVESVFKANAD